jgi:S-formylglutathione hydrolase
VFDLEARRQSFVAIDGQIRWAIHSYPAACRWHEPAEQAMKRVGTLAVIAVLANMPEILGSQTVTPQQRGTVERIRVHGKGLEDNLSGDSPDRDISVYLPASYQKERSLRYPVVYMLHGFTDDDARWMGLQKHWINLAAVLDKTFENDGAHEMIVVMPNAFTRFQGSMYSTSATIGDWENYIARELVAWIDGNYRTLADRASRGLAGHSMGGYGTLRIAMRNPEVFSSIYALSSCCLIPDLNPESGGERFARALAVKDAEEIADADFGTKAMLASAAAWSPNPEKPPLFIDLPWSDGQLQPVIAAKWYANAPLAMVDQYVPNLRRLQAIAFDAGAQDTRIAATVKTLDEMLARYKIPHTSEIYDGNHTNRIAERMETKTVPFFRTHLKFGTARRK